MIDSDEIYPFAAYRDEPGFAEHDAATCVICQEAEDEEDDEDVDDEVDDKCDRKDCPMCWPETEPATAGDFYSAPTMTPFGVHDPDDCPFCDKYGNRQLTEAEAMFELGKIFGTPTSTAPIWEQDLGDDTDRDVEQIRRGLVATAMDFNALAFDDLPAAVAAGSDYMRGYRAAIGRVKESFEIFGNPSDGAGFHRRFREGLAAVGANTSDAGGVTVVSDTTSGVVTQ